MNLHISWSAPSPIPGCGYKALYRRKSDASYTQVETSGSTLTLGISAPASYEGKLISDCCNDFNSAGVAFGINSYSPITVTAAIALGVITVTATSLYGNPYDIIITGTLNAGATPLTFSFTYPADSVTYDSALSGQYGGPVTAVVVTAISPIFDNGGQLQQLDAVNTPAYFKPYWVADTSGSTWDGAPISLPSFTLDAFTPTEYAVDGITVLAGTLNMSYILSSLVANSFNTLTFEVYDATNALIGSSMVTKSPLGLRNEIISLTKVTSPLTTATAFTMKAVWPDLSVIATKTFYLPS